MYPASSAFHQAVREGKPQKALLIFSDTVFTNDDIDVEQGIELTDVFNKEEDLSIGQALSNQLRFSLFNDERLLNNYSFGPFTATIGVQVSQSNYKQFGYVTVVSGGNTYYGSKTYPYLTRNGSTMPVSFPVSSIAVYNGTVYVFGQNGNYAVFNDGGGQQTGSLNAFMLNKASTRWEGKGFYYNHSSRTLREYIGGVCSTYEFVPLGIFTAVRPNVADVIEIDFDCYDRMQLFDKDMPASLGLTYPCTIHDILQRLCSHAGVPCGASGYINSSMVVEEEPEVFKKSTMRKVIGWIAEVACANARIDRDGVLQLQWVNQTSQVYDESMYADFNPYWYTTPGVGKLYNRDTAQVLEETTGSGTNGYLIQDNPFMALHDDEEEDDEG